MSVEGRPRQRRALWLALGANAGFMVAELVGGFVFGSLALLADGAHMLSDVVALSIALLALRLAQRPATVRHTFGLQRAEVLGAQANGIVLLAAAAWILIEATRRLGSPPEVLGSGVLVVASLGLVVNVVSAAILRQSAGNSLNMRGALTHMELDAAGSIGAIAAGVGIVVWEAAWVDPAVSFGIGGLVLWSAWRLLRRSTHVLLEGAPAGLDVEVAERLLADDPMVTDVHHVHVWSLASDVPALSAHVVLADDVSLHDAQLIGDQLKARLADHMGIHHTTLELECHVCEPEGRSPTA